MDKKPIIDIKEDITFIKDRINNIEKNIQELKQLFKEMKQSTSSIIESIELKELHDKRIEQENIDKINNSWFWK